MDISQLVIYLQFECSIMIYNTGFWSTLNHFVEYSVLWEVRAFPLSHIQSTALLYSFQDDTGSSWRAHDKENKAHPGDIPCATRAQRRVFTAHVLTVTTLNHVIKMVIYPTQERDDEVVDPK